jgi:hypothetical protein
MYVAGTLKGRPDMEAINTDLLYFCLLMKLNFYAKEVYFQRKNNSPNDQIEKIYKFVTYLRHFVLDFFEIPYPNWELIQNELEDSLEVLDSLPLQEDNASNTLGGVASSHLKRSETQGEKISSQRARAESVSGEDSPYPADVPVDSPDHVSV